MRYLLSLLFSYKFYYAENEMENDWPVDWQRVNRSIAENCCHVTKLKNWPLQNLSLARKMSSEQCEFLPKNLNFGC